MPTAVRRKPTDAIRQLKSDHAEVKRFYQEYKRLVKGKAKGRVRQVLAMRICDALSVHAAIEEQVFYPAVRIVLEDVTLLEHAEVEHGTAKDLIRRIKSLLPSQPRFDATVCVLCEYVAHHVKEEEQEIFPLVERTELDLVRLGAEMQAMRATILANIES